MPRIDLASIEATNRTTYPPPYAADMARRYFRRLAPATGLSGFTASHVTLKPGGMSSQRHWHDEEDELVVMVAGEAVLVEDEGETVLRTGDCAVFLKGVRNGHHLINRGDCDCVFVAIGGPPKGDCHYPDIDLEWRAGAGHYTRKDGRPYD